MKKIEFNRVPYGITEDTLMDGYEAVLNKIGKDVPKNHILAVSTNEKVIFLPFNEVEKLFNEFSTNKGNLFIKCKESTVFDDEYGNDFGVFIIKKLELGDDARWFYSLLEFAWDIIACWHNNNKCSKSGFDKPFHELALWDLR